MKLEGRTPERSRQYRGQEFFDWLVKPIQHNRDDHTGRVGRWAWRNMAGNTEAQRDLAFLGRMKRWFDRDRFDRLDREDWYLAHWEWIHGETFDRDVEDTSQLSWSM